MKKININELVGFTILVVVAGVTSFTGVYITRKMENKPSIQSQVLPSQFPDYDAIMGKNKDNKIIKIDIAKDFKSDKPANIKFDEISKRYKVTGKFSRAYLFIDALVDNTRPLTSWDDIYFKLNGQGGHLFPDGNVLPTPPGNSTTYLYNLGAISYYPSMDNKLRNINKKDNVNMFDLIKDGATIKAVTAISSNRPGRILKEVSIYYECFEGSKCSITELR